MATSSGNVFIWYEVIYKDAMDSHRCSPSIRHFKESEHDLAVQFLKDKLKDDLGACLNKREIG